MTLEPLTNAAAERAIALLTSPIDRDWWTANALGLLTPDFVREDRRRLIALPEIDGPEYQAAFLTWFDIGDGRPYFVGEVLEIRGRRCVLFRTHIEFQSGEQGGSHLVAMQFDEPVRRWERMVAFDPDDLDDAVAELDRMYAHTGGSATGG